MYSFHVYKDLWARLIGKEGLECLREKANKNNFAKAVYRNNLCRKLVVRHLPLNLFKVLLKLSYPVQ